MRNFWIQPAGGFTEKSRGLTEALLRRREKQNGYRYPELYRELMKLQNGGYLRRQRLPDDDPDGLIESFEQIGFDDFEIRNFWDYMLQTQDPGEVLEATRTYDFCDPKRLVVFSDAGAFGVCCFDYGWLQKQERQEPQIVFVSNAGSQFIHYDIRLLTRSFADLISAMSGQTDSIYIGIRSELAFEQLTQAIRSRFEIPLKKRTDDGDGWLNFDHYYHADIPLIIDDATIKKYAEKYNQPLPLVRDWFRENGHICRITSRLSFNQHRSGTYLFQDDAEYNVVLKTPAKVWFDHRGPLEWFIAELRELPSVEEVGYLEDNSAS